MRGKHARHYAQRTNGVVLDTAVAKLFPNAGAVNDSLRALGGIIRLQNKVLAGQVRRMGEVGG